MELLILNSCDQLNRVKSSDALEISRFKMVFGVNQETIKSGCENSKDNSKGLVGKALGISTLLILLVSLSVVAAV